MPFSCSTGKKSRNQREPVRHLAQKHGGFLRKKWGDVRTKWGLCTGSALYFGFAATLRALPSRSTTADRSKKARPSMNFTEGARPTADFGRFGRKNTDSARESMLFLAVSFTFTANNRYFCNIFYPLWRKSTFAFCPA